MDMTIKSSSFAVGLFISASLLSFGDTIMQAPAPTDSSAVGQQLALPPAVQAFRKTAAAYDPINNPESFDPMYDAVMGKFHNHMMDPRAAKMLKPTLSKLEMAYWQGKHPGIDEADIVNLVNTFADSHKLPEIAKTTPSQVHYLRMRGILFGEPEFCSKGVSIRKDEETGELTTASTKMSPLQAFDFVQVLIDRKIIDEEFQKTPADWEDYLKNKTNTPRLQAQGWKKASPEGMSINNSLRRAFNLMTTAEAVSLVSKTLNGVNSR